MKHAFLIQAHQDVEQLYKLINALDSNDSSFYIHWDKKHERILLDSILYNTIKNKPNIFFVENINVYWGGVSMVLATIKLLKEAIKDKNIQYFHLLSGEDYPIKSFKYISNFFKNNQHNYLTYIPNESIMEYYINRYYFYDNDFMDVRNSNTGVKKYLIKSILLFIQRISWFFVQKIKIPIRKKISIKYYHGSNWFSFTNEAVSYILKRITEEPWLLKRFKYTAVCDESFFIMLMMDNPQFKDSIINDDLRLRMSDGSLNRGGYIYTEKDFDHIIKSTALFGRKFRTGISDELILNINQKILNIKHSNE